MNDVSVYLGRQSGGGAQWGSRGDSMDSMDSMEPLFLKGCIWKYYAQTYQVHYTHTGATHLSFTVAIAHVCQLNNFLYQEFNTRMAYIAQEVSELKQRFYSCIAPFAAICYQYESAYFPSCFAASVARNRVMSLVLRALKTKVSFRSRCPISPGVLWRHIPH